MLVEFTQFEAKFPFFPCKPQVHLLVKDKVSQYS